MRQNKPRQTDKIRKDLLALQALIHTQGGRLNTIDPRSAHTKDQVQKQEQLEAVEQLVNRHDNVKGKYESTTTLRTKQRWSQFSIAEFLTKEARNEFVELVGIDALICHEQIAVGRAQILKSSAKPTNPSAVQ